MKIPTSAVIKERVSEGLDDQLAGYVSGLVVESALKASSKRKRRAAAKKKEWSTQGATPQNDIQNSKVEYVEEVCGLTESGEIKENELTCYISTINSYDGATFNTNSSCCFNTGTNRARNQARGRGRQPFVRHTVENNPYDVCIATLNFYDNQVLPIGIHKLSKSCRPNLATIRVL